MLVDRGIGGKTVAELFQNMTVAEFYGWMEHFDRVKKESPKTPSKGKRTPRRVIRKGR